MGCFDYLANTSGGFGSLGKENFVQTQRHQCIHRTNATQLKKKHEVTGTQCINRLKKGGLLCCYMLASKYKSVCMCVCVGTAAMHPGKQAGLTLPTATR